MRRLYTSIYFHFLGVLFVVGLATSAVFAVGARGMFVREMIQRIERHMASLIEEQHGDPAAIARRVHELHDDLGVDVTVRGSDGAVMATEGRELPALTPGEMASAASGHVMVHHGVLTFAATPVRDSSGRVVAMLEASMQSHFRQPSVARPVLAVLLMLVIVAVATRPLARRISRPIERLTEATRRLGGGDLSYRIPTNWCEPGDGKDGDGKGWAGRRARWRRHGWGHGLADERRRWQDRPYRFDELQALTRAFNEMAERVERLVRGQKELLANVSHELRSPLARIRMALELLPREADAEPRFRDVEGDLGELDRLIEDVLTASRLDATGLPTHLGPVDVRQLLTQIAERAAIDPLTAGIDVRISPGAPLTLQADGGLVKRALWNLVENAAKYGAPPITLSATLSATGGRATLDLCVADEGQGIAAGDRERVLAAFVRLDKARTPSATGERHRGFGLGLTLARKVAEVHGGAIAIAAGSVDAAGVERGCRITISLPAASDGQAA